MIAHANVNFQSQEQAAGMPPVPPGAYEGQILGARVEPRTSGGQDLVILLEITAGEFAGYFKRQYEAASAGQYGKKYKGTLRQRIPNYNSSGQPATDGDSYAHRALQHMAWALEQSNDGYRWDWDETKLKGKVCAFSVRERDWFMEAAEEERGYRTGTTTEIYRLESLPAFKAGKVRLQKKRELGQQDKEKKAELDRRFEHGEPSPLAEALGAGEDLPF